MAFLFYGCSSSHPPAPTSASGPIRFVDITQKAGIRFERQNGAFGKRWMPETMGGGGAFIDYDNDGYLDILFVNGDWWTGHALPGRRPTLALFHNNQNGSFTDVTDKIGLNVPLQGMGVAVGDYDNDGWADFYVTGVGGNRLFHNQQGKRFVERSEVAGVRDRGWSTSAAWLDYDNDGKLDLFVCHYVKWTPETDQFCGSEVKIYCLPSVYEGESCRLYHNEGQGKFVDITQKAGLFNPRAKGLGVCIWDVDRNGAPDIVVACDMVPNLVFRNNGNGTFTEIGLEMGLALGENGTAHAGMGIDAAYYRNDDRMGLAIGNFTNDGIFLYDFQAGATRSERSPQLDMQRASMPYVTFGLSFGDFDNDRLSDIVVTNGHVDDLLRPLNGTAGFLQPSQVFHNSASGSFVDVSKSAGEGITRAIAGRGVCVGDFNNDGLLDLLLTPNTGSPILLQNESRQKQHWAQLKLQGTKSNRDGFGALVTVTSNGQTQTAYLHSGAGYLSSNDTRLHYGLGTASRIETVVIRWPTGRTESWSKLSVDRTLLLKEGEGTPQ